MRQRPIGKRIHHFHLAGGIYLGVTILIGVGAINSQNNLLFLIFGLAMAAIPVSGGISRLMLRNLEIQRSLAVTNVAGLPTFITYRVTNHRRLLSSWGLLIEEIETRAESRSDRSWSRLFSRPVSFVTHVAPGETAQAEARFNPIRRGCAHLDRIRISTRFPFGIIWHSATFSVPQSIIVQPAPRSLRRDVLSRIANRSESGVTSSSHRGRGDEFYSVRDYSPGDSMRLIAWKPTARTGELVVRENTDPADTHVWCILDLTRPPESRVDKRRMELEEQAITITASLIVASMQRGVDVGLSLPGFGIVVPPGGSIRHRRLLLDTLGRIDPAHPDDSESTDDPIGSIIGPRSMSVVVHVDEIDPTVGPAMASHLRAQDLQSILEDQRVPDAPGGEIAS